MTATTECKPKPKIQYERKFRERKNLPSYLAKLKRERISAVEVARADEKTKLFERFNGDRFVGASILWTSKEKLAIRKTGRFGV